MDLAGTAIPDDEFNEEPHLEEAKVLEEIPNAVRLAIMRIHENLGHPCKELLCRALRIGGATEVRRLLGEQSSEKPLACEVGRYVHRLQSRCRSRSIHACGLRRTSV